MSKGIKKKKFARCRPENQSKGRRQRGGKERESGYHMDNKKTRASSTRERMIHQFKCGTQRQRPLK